MEVSQATTLFRETTLGVSLKNACEKMLQDGKINADTKTDIMSQFDKVIFFPPFFSLFIIQITFDYEKQKTKL